MPTRREAMLSAMAATLPVKATAETIEGGPAALIIKYPAGNMAEAVQARGAADLIGERLNIEVIVIPDSWELEIVSQEQLKQMGKTGIS